MLPAQLDPLHETAEERARAAPPSATYARDTDVRFRTVADTACFGDSAQSMRATRPGGRERSVREGQT